MPFKVDITADNVRFLRDQTGFGLMQCREAMDHAETDEFRGDVVLGIAYIHVGGFTTDTRTGCGRRSDTPNTCARGIQTSTPGFQSRPQPNDPDSLVRNLTAHKQRCRIRPHT